MPRSDLDFCYLTTVGRRTGHDRTIEIWYGLAAKTVYVLSGSGDSAHWVRNIQAFENVKVRIGRRTYEGTARFIDAKDEDAKARRLLAGKYEEWEPGKRLSSWARNSLPVAIDLAIP